MEPGDLAIRGTQAPSINRQICNGVCQTLNEVCGGGSNWGPTTTSCVALTTDGQSRAQCRASRGKFLSAGAANVLENKLTRAQYLDEVTWTTKSWLGLQKQRISVVLHTAIAEQIVQIVNE